MKQALKKYQLQLKVCGPVFVGDGLEIQKKEYMFLDRETIGIIDAGKLYQMAKRRHLESDLEQFMLINNKEDLRHWTERNRVPFKELQSCMKYTIHTGDIQRNKARMQIMSCIKDPYGNPYLPGSSIKGMLRTVLGCDELLANPERYRREAQRVKNDLKEDSGRRRNQVLARNARDIEAQIFHTLDRTDHKVDAVNDRMCGIVVGDSEPLSTEDLILCQKWEQHTDGSYKTINLLRECLKPGTIIKADLTIDETVNPITPDQIQRAVKNFYEQYYDVFQKKFARQDRKSDQTVFVGGGSGFVSKTVVYSLLEEREAVPVVREIFRKTGASMGRENIRLNVSPRILKCTRYQGKEYMMGQCELKII